MIKPKRVRQVKTPKADVPLTSITPRNAKQAEYLTALRTKDQVISIGPAGAGKTWLATCHAGQQLIVGKKERLIFTRPTISRKEHELGFLPGTADEKIEPWLVPIMDSLSDVMSTGTIARRRKEGSISYLPFQHMRGRTLKDAIVVLDEAQNCDLESLKMFVTRMGEGSQFLINGDLEQVDIKNSGLTTLMKIAKLYVPSVSVIEFGDEDIVRSVNTKQWVTGFRRYACNSVDQYNQLP